MNIIKRVFGFIAAASLVALLTACGGASNDNDAADTKPTTSTSTSDKDKTKRNNQRELVASLVEELEQHNWKVDADAAASCGPFTEDGWTHVCAVKVDVPGDPRGCFQPWLVEADGTKVVRFAGSIGGVQEGPDNPDGGSMVAPACNK